ncbi:MAG: hypothetical protein ACYCYO_04840 [Bacilli bacterium]
MKRKYIARMLGSIIAAGMLTGVLSIFMTHNYLIMPPIGTMPPIRSS